MAAGNGTATPRRQRSRITKGSKLLPSVTKTSVWGRIMGDTLDEVLAHCGGADCISGSSVCRPGALPRLRLSSSILKRRSLPSGLTGKIPRQPNLDLYGRLANRAAPAVRSLGLGADGQETSRLTSIST